mgnify:CR=1 FL=1
MKPKRIHIVGIYGTGKSTLAKKIGKILGNKIYDLDEIKYKRKYDKSRTVKERLKIIKEISNKKTWITEGTWLDYALPLYKKADLIIFLEIPKRTIYKRILTRYIKRRLSKKRYLKDNLKTTKKIMKKVKQYHSNQSFLTLKKHRDYLKKYAKKVIIIKTEKDIKKVLKKLK